jgi:hypothetical protein
MSCLYNRTFHLGQFIIHFVSKSGEGFAQSNTLRESWSGLQSASAGGKMPKKTLSRMVEARNQRPKIKSRFAATWGRGSGFC